MAEIFDMLHSETDYNEKTLTNIAKELQKGTDPKQIAPVPIKRLRLNCWKAAGEDRYLIHYTLLEKITSF